MAFGLTGAAGLAIALLPVTWAAALVAGAVVVAVTLVHPPFGVLLLIPAVPFGSLRQMSLGGLNVGLAEVLLGLALIAWLARMLTRGQLRFVWPALTLPLFLFLGAMLLSLPQASSWRHAAKEILKWLETLALLVLVAKETDERWARLFVLAFLGTGALAALHGIYQFLFQVGPEGFVLFGRFMRAYGTFDQPNPYGGYLGLTLPLAVGLLLARLGYRGSGTETGRRARLGWGWTFWAAGCGGLMAIALVMSWSRGAWLGAAVALAVMGLAVVVRGGQAAVVALAVAILIVIGVLAGGIARVPPALVARLSDLVPFTESSDIRGVEVTDANFAVIERMAHWQAAAAMWTDHPWLGVGIGNYEAAYSRYALPRWPLPLGHAHNYYLNIAAETGVVGLLSYLWFWAMALLAAWRAIGRTVPTGYGYGVERSAWRWGLALGTLGVIVHLSVHNLFDNLFVHGMYLHIAILLGLIPNLVRQSSPSAVASAARCRPAEWAAGQRSVD